MDHDSYAPLMTHPLTIQPLTLPHRHHIATLRPALDTAAFLYISQPSGYRVAPVLTWLPSHTFCAITSWILPVHPLCATALHRHSVHSLESLRSLFAESSLLT